jgi:hypothetical protein
MTTVVGSQFDNSKVLLDGNDFTACEFRNCTLIYNGGEMRMSENRFTECLWKFGGGALRTIQLLRDIHASPGGKELVEQVIDQIRGSIP